jgi:sec-independent protein translocase protein TatB
MFDIGFWEMAFIGVIALVVIGPERLPGVARNVGLWVGKGRRMLNEVKTDVKREMKEYDIEQVAALKNELDSASKNLKDITSSNADPLGLKDVSDDLKSTVEGATGSKHEVETITPQAAKQSRKKAIRKKKVTKPRSVAKKTARKQSTKPATGAPVAKKQVTRKPSTRKSSTSKPVPRKTVQTGKKAKSTAGKTG